MLLSARTANPTIEPLHPRGNRKSCKSSEISYHIILYRNLNYTTKTLHGQSAQRPTLATNNNRSINGIKIFGSSAKLAWLIFSHDSLDVSAYCFSR